MSTYDAMKARAEAAEARVKMLEQELSTARKPRFVVGQGHLDRVRELEAQNARLREALEDEYQRVAPVIVDYPVRPWEHLGEGRMLGTWAEDGSPYRFSIPFQLVPAFQAMQRLASLTKKADTKGTP